MFPAWLVLIYGTVAGELSSTAVNIALVMFVSIGTLELMVVARALSRMDF
jgi:hypothetical protein